MDKEKHSLTSSTIVRYRAIRELEHLEEIKSVPQAGLKGPIKYLKEGPKQLGRPQGTARNDDQRLRRMKELLRTGEAKSIHDAARQVARDKPDFATHKSLVRRLQGKFKETPPDE